MKQSRYEILKNKTCSLCYRVYPRLIKTYSYEFSENPFTNILCPDCLEELLKTLLEAEFEENKQ